MVKSLKIVVTGASGFIAKNLRKYLSEKNIELISISRNDFKILNVKLKLSQRIMKKRISLKKYKIQMH
jgi:hypothetical protein